MMVNNTIDFKYVPLSFISSQNEIERQSLNTILFQQVLEEFGELKSIGELLDFTQYGYTASAMQKGNCRFLRITDINNGKVSWDNIPYCDCETIKKYELSSKDILIARTGNNISYLVDESVPNNTVFASYLIRLVCNKEKLLPEYLYLFLNSYAFWPQILEKQRGALLQNVNAQRMKELLIPYCPIEDQKKLIANTNKKIWEIQKRIKNLLDSKQQLKTELTYQQTLIKKLQQQILQEAIEGKLTTGWRKRFSTPPRGRAAKQGWGKYEYASVLLERIIAEKNQMIKDKKIKPHKTSPPISDEYKPFPLPPGWVWCRLGDIIIIQYGKGLAKSETKSVGKYAVYGSNGIVGFYDRGLTDNRAIIIGRKGSAGALQVASSGSWTTDVSYYVEDDKNIIFDYLFFLLQSLRLEDMGKGIKPGLNRNEAYNSVIPLPPFAEQKAIATKVEKLLALCDQLETKITENKTHAEQLMRAVLKEVFAQK